MKAIKKSLMAGAFATTFGFGISASAATVDLFSDPADFTTNAVTDTTASPVAGSGVFQEHDGGATIIGGSRDLYVQAISVSAGAAYSNMYAGGGVLSFSNNAGTTGYGVVQWDGDDNSPDLATTGLNKDLTAGCGGPCTSFIASVLLADFNFGYKITVVDMDGDKSVLTASSQFSVGPDNISYDVQGPVDAVYLFSWFNLPAAPGYFKDNLLFDIERTGGEIDFSRIGALQLELNVDFTTADPDVLQRGEMDLQLASITSRAPEPSALALVGIGLLGAAVVGRRRKGIKA